MGDGEPGGQLRIALLTVGDPSRISGGFLYHQRVVERAGEHRAVVRFVSVPDRPYPLGVVDGRRAVRDAVSGSDVVVVDSLASNVLGPLMRFVPPGVGLVGSVHQGLGGIDTGPLRRIVQQRFDRAAWRACSHLVVASDALAGELATAGVPAPAMVVAPPGRDVVPARRGPPPARGTGRPLTALCVGNWLPRKGILEVVEALARTPAGSVTLHLAGDEDVDRRYRRRVLRRLADPLLGERVVRHGVVAPAAMQALYDAADVFVLGSTVEPYGSVYGEAMTAGLPVLGWAAGNLPNLVDDGVEGRLLPVDDVDGLAASLVALADDPDRRNRLGRAARERAAELPTWDDTADRFFDTCRAAQRRSVTATRR